MQTKIPVTTLAFALLASSFVTSAEVTETGWETKFTASDPANNAQFGESVALSGDSIVIGKPRDNHAGVDSGSAYLFQPDGAGGWQEHKFTSSDAEAHDWFGWSVDISGNNVLIGASYDDGHGPGSGSAYLFRPDGQGGWSEHKFTASDAGSYDWFGTSVALSGDNVLVGASGNRVEGIRTGSAYLFQPDGQGGWSEQKITASDAASDDRFGHSVAISGDNILVGARDDDERGTEAGSAYLFQPDGHGGWSEQKFLASDGSAYDDFGGSVALSGDNVLVGARDDDEHGTRSGSAYLFQPDGHGGWTEQKFTASDAAPEERFGHSVAISSDTLVIGSKYEHIFESEEGAAYVFHPVHHGGWSERRVTAIDASDDDAFGEAVAADGDRWLAGARGAAGGGAAYLYSMDTDGDCFTDADEVAAGSDENHPRSVPSPVGPIDLPWGRPVCARVHDLV